MKHFNRFLSVALVCGLAALSSGCSKQLQEAKNFVQSVSTATISQNSVIIARVSFNSAQALATNYLRAKRCDGSNGPLCRDPALTVRIGNAVHSGRDARNAVTAFMKRNPGVAVPISNYDAMTTATSTINDLTAAYRAARGS